MNKTSLKQPQPLAPVNNKTQRVGKKNGVYIMRNELMNKEATKRYHELTVKADRTKEENRELEQLKKLARMNGCIRALDNIAKNDDVNILEYDNVNGLYRLQLMIKNRYKTIARIKLAKRDVYILVRETTAKELHKKYELINYNLPAGYHVELEKLYTELTQIINYHRETQTA